MARPTDYNPEIAALICERVATHTCGLNVLCRMYDDLPVKSTVNLWRHKHPEFSAQYASAKLFQADLLAEECLEISDDTSNDTKIDPETGHEVANHEYIARSRLRVDTRKWLAAKLLPKQYGNREQDNDESNMKSIVEKLIDKIAD